MDCLTLNGIDGVRGAPLRSLLARERGHTPESVAAGALGHPLLAPAVIRPIARHAGFFYYMFLLYCAAAANSSCGS